MMTIADIRPDAELKHLLEGKITIQTSAAGYTTLPVYQQGGRPNTGAGDEFIDVTFNGGFKAMLQPLGFYRGNLAVSVYCRTFDDGSVKQRRVSAIVGQLEKYLKYRSYGRCFFELNPQNIITPTTTNVVTGYSVTVLNVAFTFNENEVVGFGLEKESGCVLLEDGGRLLSED